MFSFLDKTAGKLTMFLEMSAKVKTPMKFGMHILFETTWYAKRKECRHSSVNHSRGNLSLGYQLDQVNDVCKCKEHLTLVLCRLLCIWDDNLHKKVSKNTQKTYSFRCSAFESVCLRICNLSFFGEQRCQRCCHWLWQDPGSEALLNGGVHIAKHTIKLHQQQMHNCLENACDQETMHPVMYELRNWENILGQAPAVE